MFDDRDGMFYYAEQNVLLLVNGGYDGETLHLADKAAYDEEFKTELIAYLEKAIDDDALFEKTYNEIMENYKSNKMTWQKMLFVEKTTLTNDIADFIIKLQ